MNKQLVYTDIDYERPLKLLIPFRNGKDAIYEDLEAYAKRIKIEDTALFRLKSNLWQLAKDTYQEWYLGKNYLIRLKKDMH